MISALKEITEAFKVNKNGADKKVAAVVHVVEKMGAGEVYYSTS
jgi:hypothetical protein